MIYRNLSELQIHPERTGNKKNIILKNYIPEKDRIPMNIKDFHLNYVTSDSKYRSPIPEFRSINKSKEIVKSASLNVIGHENRRIQKVLNFNSGINTETHDEKVVHPAAFRPYDKGKWVN
jgi:aryl-alcohol dehydrogenase-like predicted oxidoreductase